MMENLKIRREFFNRSGTAGGIRLINCGYESGDIPFCSERCGEGGYVVFNVTEGKGSFEADGESFEAANDDVFVCRPGISVHTFPEGRGKSWSFC